MSEESTTSGLAERWRHAAEAAYRGDLDATMAIFAPDAVWEVQPLGISHKGAPAIRSFLEEWLGSVGAYQDHPGEGLAPTHGVGVLGSRTDASPVGRPRTAHG